MMLHNNRMENLRKSREIALDLIEDTKDLFEGIFVDKSPSASAVRKRGKVTPDSAIDVDIGPSTSSDKKHTEYVKYGKITFDTTAILHHYPQNRKSSVTSNHCADAGKNVPNKADLNLPLKINSIENNNDDKSENKETPVVGEKKTEVVTNNNGTNTVAKVDCLVKSDKGTILVNPVKFTEEKLV